MAGPQSIPVFTVRSRWASSRQVHATTRSLIGAPRPPREVWLAHSPFHDPALYERHFGAPVRFSQPLNAILFDPRVLDEPIPRADALSLRYLESLAERLSAERPPPNPATLAERVRSAISSCLQEGEVSQERAARRLALSARTLQRRLQEEGTSFSDLHDEVLAVTAKALLRAPGRMIHDVAFALGYAETSSFYRAFKRWTGVTPEEWRSAAAREARQG
jgi:AraC-like DNA-binding protein